MVRSQPSLTAVDVAAASQPKSPYSDLIRRVEEASGPDREIDCLLARELDGFVIQEEQYREPSYCYFDRGGTFIRPGGGGDRLVPYYTASLDAALALVERVLPGWCCSVVIPQPRPCEGYAWDRGHTGNLQGKGATPALALVAALLKALEAQHG